MSSPSLNSTYTYRNITIKVYCASRKIREVCPRSTRHGNLRGSTSLVVVIRRNSHAIPHFRLSCTPHTSRRQTSLPTSTSAAARRHMLTHLTRRRAAAAVTRLTVISTACIQITFRVTLRITHVILRRGGTQFRFRLRDRGPCSPRAGESRCGRRQPRPHPRVSGDVGRRTLPHLRGNNHSNRL